MSNKKKSAIISISGGMDSVTLLYYLHDQEYDLKAYSFFMNSKHNEKELPLAKWHCDKLNIPHQTIDISYINGLFKSDLLKSGGEIPEGLYDQESMKQTVIPFRNGIMLSNLVGIADSVEADYVALGSHAGDHAIYPDCRPDFNIAFEQAAKAGTFRGVEFLRPFQNMTKSQVGEVGLDLGVDYSTTWSCYRGENRPCLKCGTCTERTEVFIDNRVQDPLLTLDEWMAAQKFYWECKNEE